MIRMLEVTKLYENGAMGLNSVSISIAQGEFVFIIGSTGSGKSTFSRLLIKEIEPTSGKIFVNGMDLSTIARKYIPHYRRKMGVVFQDYKLLQNKTVFDNVAFAMQIVGASNREIRRNVPSALSSVGLSKKMRAYPDQLSGGEQQRAALARAIINNPPLLLCDEPTGNLDPNTAWEIMDILGEINASGTTVVVATHAREIVDNMNKRVIALVNGSVSRDEKSGYGAYSDA